MNCQGFRVKADLKGLGTPILGRNIFSKKREYMLAPLVNFLKPYQDKKKILYQVANVCIQNFNRYLMSITYLNIHLCLNSDFVEKAYQRLSSMFLNYFIITKTFPYLMINYMYKVGVYFLL